jgi:hypothetical protein
LINNLTKEMIMEIVTENLNDFGYRELEEASKLTAAHEKWFA